MPEKIPDTPKAQTRSTLRKLTLVGLLALTSAAFEAPAQASYILNGTFTSTTGTLGASGGGLNVLNDYTSGASLTDWTIADVGTSTGLALLYTDGNQGSKTTNGDGISLTGRFGGYSLYDPGNVSGSTPHGGAIPNTSPGGGNFIVADGSALYNVAIYQTMTGLTAGTVYAVSFWYAAGQQYNFTGTTTEGWQVSLESTAQTTQVTNPNGTTIQDTPAQAGGSLANGSFQAWAQETFDFTASSSTQILTFLSMGTPSGQPPADLLSGVVMNAIVTPEPASLAFSGIGMSALVALLWFRKSRARKAAAQ